jgi:hypothetical protein
LGSANKSNSNSCLLLPRSENVRNLPTKATNIGCILSSRICQHCALFSRAAKDFGICQQKATQIDCILSSRAPKGLGTRLVQPHSEIFWNLPPNASKVDCILISPTKATQILSFVQPRSENVRNLPTKATPIDCILSSRGTKVLEFANIVLCSAE